LLAAAVVVEAGIGAAIATSHSKYALALVVGCAACALIWRFPIVGCIAELWFVGGIIYPEFYVYYVGGHTVYAYEIVLVVLLARAAIAPARRTWGGAMGGWLLAFLVVLTISTAMAIHAGNVSLNDAVNWGRPFYALAFFWVVIRLCPDRRTLAILLTAGIVLGAISGVVGAWLAIDGHVSGIFAGSGMQVLVTNTAGSLRRVRMPGLGLGYMLLWLALLWLTRSRRPKLLWAVCVPLTVLVILVSQYRDMWVLSVMGLVWMMLVSGARSRGRLIAGLVVILAGVAILLELPQSGPTPLKPIIQRGTTLLNPHEVAKSQSATDRSVEDHYAFADFKRHPLLGIGPGVPYGSLVASPVGNDQVEVQERLYVENQWMYLLLITGVVGTVCMFAFFALALRYAFIRGGSVDARMLGIGVFALMITSIILLSLSTESFCAPLALCAGGIWVLRPPPAARAGDRWPRALARTP
jgi:O-antigen ligase